MGNYFCKNNKNNKNNKNENIILNYETKLIELKNEFKNELEIKQQIISLNNNYLNKQKIIVRLLNKG